MIPVYVAKSPIIILEATYEDAYQNCPSRSIPIVSFEKAEKVVNPPRNPVAKNNLHSGVRLPRSPSPKTNPIRKQPEMFTVNVPKGKVERNLV
jgi:hypothetical protein